MYVEQFNQLSNYGYFILPIITNLLICPKIDYPGQKVGLVTSPQINEGSYNAIYAGKNVPKLCTKQACTTLCCLIKVNQSNWGKGLSIQEIHPKRPLSKIKSTGQ